MEGVTYRSVSWDEEKNTLWNYFQPCARESGGGGPVFGHSCCGWLPHGENRTRKTQCLGTQRQSIRARSSHRCSGEYARP